VGHDDETIRRAMELTSKGHSDYAVARETGVPRSTVRNWRVPRRGAPTSACVFCDGPGLEAITVHHEQYSYLLGQYLGDGWVGPNGGF
jgi:diadenosine tetraphosphatase ApaH/serine/threonine PP2A family protein phosphatase